MAIVLLSLSAEARAKKPPATRPPREELSTGNGKVTFVTGDRAFLDKGTADGVSAGQTIDFVRGRQKIACKVESASAHFASCTGGVLQVGDRFTVKAPPAPEPPKTLPPLPTQTELSRRRAMVESARHTLVGFEGEGISILSGATIQAAFTHRTWASYRAGHGPFQQDRLDARADGVELGHGLRLWADLSAQAWPVRPAGYRMEQPGAVLLVRRAEIEAAPGGTFPIALGRTWVRNAPMVTMIDGAQAGISTADRSRVFGVYAGGLPDAFTLAPRFDQYTAGIYGAADIRGADGSQAYGRVEGRASYVRTADIGGRLETALSGHAWLSTSTSAHAEALYASPGGLQAARLDLDARPVPTLPIRLSARYDDSRFGDVLLVGASFRGRRAVHADASFGLEPAPWLRLDAFGFYADDLDSKLAQGQGGLQLSLPSALFNRGGFAFGHSEEFGWLRGRTTFAELSLRPSEVLTVRARISLFTQLLTQASGGYAGNELGGYFSADARLTRHLWLRASITGQQELAQYSSDVTPTATALIAGLTLGGDF